MLQKIKKVLFRFHILSLVIIAGYILLALRQIQTNSFTFDEPAHIRSGLEWLTTGYSPSDPFNPPLTKIPFGLLQLLGYRLLSDPFLHLARLVSVGITALFFVYFYFWTRKIFSQTIAFIGLLFLVCEPTVLAYTHLATTEAMSMAVVFFVFTRGVEAFQKRSVNNFCVFIFSLFLLFLSKTVFLIAFLPLCIYVFLSYKRFFSEDFFLPVFITIMTCMIISLLFVGGHSYHVFLFSFPGAGILRTTFSAISFVFNPKYTPTRSFIFFGKVYQKGVYIYPLVVFLLKTTPQLLILFTLFLIKKYYKYQLVLQVSLITILAFFIIVVIGNYNIGQRHLLPVFPLIALVSSVTFYTLIKGTKNFFLKYGVIVTLGVLCMFSAITPDSIAYITPVVGPVIGGNIIGESNFDWGQSLPILAQE
ncbi:MAG: glycosyltransferase family 39 protein, partial [Patescibacteria group bacterium]|nr:glycosyltransferase family 39 protein [Patescibacteria group bacterium]